jgi:hypothetical protein
MSILAEEKQAIKMAERLLYRLIQPSETKGVPLALRKEAQWILRHYPGRTRTDLIFDFVENGMMP